ncbi:MAG: nicotinate-nucleotide adenylyltransferase [Bifidobacteriaceae bacterium]|jgi:nicotinate-nucleotide adenylyltransferase|nr:nicotinate-nucleotide adenylyltransferase [Bifidobacteriaceae bacterium]
MGKKLRIGIMGGTFDPIHNGHLVAASEAQWHFDLHEVIFMPTGHSYFKDDKIVTESEHRYLMSVIATSSNPRFRTSRLEIDRTGNTYTIDTLKKLHADYPNAELYFITGADIVEQMATWKDADELFSLAHFVAVSRPGHKIDSKFSEKMPVTGLEIPALAISSTDCRNRAKQGKPLWYLVPDGIVQYINKHELYRY